MQTRDLSGQKFGRLTALSFAGYSASSGKRRASWNCRCDCGQERAFDAFAIYSGSTKSCGCFARERAAETARRVGLANAKSPGSAAARGVFARYRHDAKRRGHDFTLSWQEASDLFAGACAYCGDAPGNCVTTKSGAFVYNGIDRIDNDKGYSVANCVSCCLRCNETKRNYTLTDFKAWIARVHKRLNGEA